MDNSPNRELLTALAEECIRRGQSKRPELHWLEAKYKALQKRYGMHKKTETDCLIYQKMYGLPPAIPSETTKIRYWRTGHHLPISREECLSFGHALDLSNHDMDILMLDYFDSCRTVYEQPVSTDAVYRKKCALMEQIVEDYLQTVPDLTLKTLNIPADNRRFYLRHLYYMDAFWHTCSRSDIHDSVLNKHIYSVNYATELTRSLQFLGPIPRKTMLRHLLLFGKARLSLNWINSTLETFEYRPLREEHTLVTGEHLDWLLIQLIRMYENHAKNHSSEDTVGWFCGSCRILDEYFLEQKQNRLRFLYFKSLRD